MAQDDPLSISNENNVLKQRIAALEAEIAFLKAYPALARGMRGAQLVANIIGGTLADYAAKYDVLKAKIKIEVKFSKLNHPNLDCLSTTRWNWSKPNGWLDKGKDYDFLLLVGEKDSRFLDQYPDDSWYVYFLIPHAKVSTILTSGKAIGANVQLLTNLKKANSPASVNLKKYLCSVKLIIEIELAVFSE
jgi:hypothetical protein